MCAPIAIPIAMFAISAASTAYSYYQSNQQANQAASLAQQQYDLQYKQQNEIYKQQRQQEQLAYERASADGLLQLQRDQQNRAIKGDELNRQNELQNLKLQQASASSAVRATEGGVGGLSVDALMSDYWRQSLDARYNLDADKYNVALEGSNNMADFGTQSRRNYDDYLRNDKNLYTNFQYSLQSLGLSNQSEVARINDSRMSPITAGLNIASSAVNAAGMGYKMSDPSVTPRMLSTTGASSAVKVGNDWFANDPTRMMSRKITV